MLPLSNLPTVKLTFEEERDLIAIVQNVPSQVVVDEDGERVVYEPSRAADRALETLTTAYIRSIFKATLSAHENRLDHDEAFAVAAAEFVQCVRDFDLGRKDDDILAWIAPTMMRRAVEREAYGSTMVKIPSRLTQRYSALMRDCEGDVMAAYRACEENSGRDTFSPSTFLAVHNALKAHDSIAPAVQGSRYEAYGSAGDGDSDTDWVVDRALARQGAADLFVSTSVEDSVVEPAYIDWLFTAPDKEAAQVLRLAYGFTDPETDNLRILTGYRTGEILADQHVGVCIGKGRVTTNRIRNRGLTAMRDAVEAELADA